MAERNASVYSASGHKKSVAQEPVTSVLKGGDVPYDPNHEWNEDEEVLAALGYKPEFKREFSLFTSFCVSFAVLGLLPSFASTLYYGMGYAGTAGEQLLLARIAMGTKQRISRNGLGLAHSYDWHTMRRHEHGRALLIDANQWRPLLRGRSPGASRMGSSRRLDHRMVELVYPNHWSAFCQLRHGSHDMRFSLYYEPGIRAAGVPSLSCHVLPHDNPCDNVVDAYTVAS